VPEVTDTLEVVLNGEILMPTGLSYFSIPRYQLGLNNISFNSISATTGEKVTISSTKFIVYKPTVSRLRTASVVKKSYVIHLNDGFEVSQVISNLGIRSDEYIMKDFVGSGETITAQFFVADLSAEQFSSASSDSMIKKIFEEEIVSQTAVQNSPTWGLDRIDQLAKVGDGKYNYGYTGAGVDIYIIDTGIRSDHVEFTGRAPIAYYIDGSFEDGEDCDGHGTHVASIAAGTSWHSSLSGQPDMLFAEHWAVVMCINMSWLLMSVYARGGKGTLARQRGRCACWCAGFS
jgi:subtilisin family serine protease